MLPPPDPLPPKAILEPELDALAVCLRVRKSTGIVFRCRHNHFGNTVSECCREDEPGARVLC